MEVIDPKEWESTKLEMQQLVEQEILPNRKQRRAEAKLKRIKEKKNA